MRLNKQLELLDNIKIGIYMQKQKVESLSSLVILTIQLTARQGIILLSVIGTRACSATMGWVLATADRCARKAMAKTGAAIIFAARLAVTADKLQNCSGSRWKTQPIHRQISCLIELPSWNTTRKKQLHFQCKLSHTWIADNSHDSS